MILFEVRTTQTEENEEMWHVKSTKQVMHCNENRKIIEIRKSFLSCFIQFYFGASRLDKSKRSSNKSEEIVFYCFSIDSASNRTLNEKSNFIGIQSMKQSEQNVNHFERWLVLICT